MYEQPSRLITIANATESGGGSFVATRKKLQTQGESKARLFLNVTALAGNIPTMDVTLVALVAGVEQEVGAFPQSFEGASKEVITIDACPASLKVVYTAGGTVTDFDATVDCLRF